MKNLFLLMATLMALVMSSCSGEHNNNTSDTDTGPSVEDIMALIDAESSDSYNDDLEQEALNAAQHFIRDEFASDAIFQEEGTIIEPTIEPNRFKVLQRFDSKDRDGYNFVYRIWVQKFPSGWEFGNLGIERAGGERVLTTNGRMKEMEQEEMTRTESSYAGDVKYTIVKRKVPNFVLVYTKKRLNRADILTVYDKLKDEYESVRFTTSTNPDDDDYLAIQNNMVFEYDKDKITKLADY